MPTTENMSKIIIPLIILITTLFSCGQEHKSTHAKVSKEVETSKIEESIKDQTIEPASNHKNIDTRYVYVDSNNHNLIIENSYPRGGLKYTNSIGEEYIYAVFWTRITNETDNPFELTMKFPKDSYDLPSSPARFFKLYIPSDTMKPEKEHLFNYGLDLEKYLDHSLHKHVALNRIINPKSSSGFYVVTLFNKGVDGTLRTGLSIKEGNLLYRINDKEISGEKVNLKELRLQIGRASCRERV